VLKVEEETELDTEEVVDAAIGVCSSVDWIGTVVICVGDGSGKNMMVAESVVTDDTES
jgi:hypothetical protein